MPENSSLPSNDRALKAQSFSLAGLLSSIGATSFACVFTVVTFLILRKLDRFDPILYLISATLAIPLKLTKYREPRIFSHTNILTEQLPRQPWCLLRRFITISSSNIAHDCGIEALFFDRYIQFLLRLFGWSVLITPAVMAYNYCLGSADGVIDALDRLSWSSLDPEQVRLYWVYAVCVPCFAGYVLFSINRELQRAVSLRSSLIQEGSRGTDRRPPRFFVAVTGIAPDLQYERGLRSYYQQWESHICTVTFVGGNFKRKLTARRNQLIRSIERCEVAFIFDEMKECAGEKISIQHRVRERVRNRYSRSLSQDRGFSRQLSQAISRWVPYNVQPVEWQYRSLGIINHAIRQQRENSPGSASSAILEIDDYLIARALVAARHQWIHRSQVCSI